MYQPYGISILEHNELYANKDKKCIDSSTDYGRPMKPSKSQSFGLGQKIWVDTFLGTWCIIGRFSHRVSVFKVNIST